MFSKEIIGQVVDQNGVVKYQKFSMSLSEIEDWFNSHKQKGLFADLELRISSRILYKNQPFRLNKRAAVYWLTIIAILILITKLVTM